MRCEFATAVCCAMVVAACNKHDPGTRPPALTSQKPASQLHLDGGTAEPPTVGSDAEAAFEVPSPDAGPLGSSSDASRVTSRANRQDAAAARPVPVTPCRVLVVGDSLTDPKSHGGGYLKPWAQHCPHCQFTNIARGGAMVNQMLRAMREHLSANPARYSTVVVFGGVNDLYSNETANRTNARIEHDLSSIYRLARSHADRVLAITIAPWGGFRRWYNDERGRNTRSLNAWILGATARNEVDSVIDSQPLLTCGDPERLCPAYMAPHRDGLHFGPEGHRRLGAALLHTLGEQCTEASSRAHRDPG